MNAATLRELLMEELPTQMVFIQDLIRNDAEMYYEGVTND